MPYPDDAEGRRQHAQRRLAWDLQTRYTRPHPVVLWWRRWVFRVRRWWNGH
jgi:hypothetical protein